MKIPDFVFMKTACRILDLSEWSVRRLTKTGVLPSQRDPSGRYVYDPADLRRLARQRADAQQKEKARPKPFVR